MLAICYLDESIIACSMQEIIAADQVGYEVIGLFDVQIEELEAALGVIQ